MRLVNATGRGGLGASNTATLRQLGFATVAPINDPAQQATTITYPAGQQAQAQALAAHVPGAAVVAGGTGRLLTLTLGSDGTEVGTAGPPTAGSSASTAAAPSSATQSFTTASCIN